jgi:hypothetical protein
MTKVTRPNRHFNSFTGAEFRELKRYDRAALKLAQRTGTPLPVAQTIAELNGLGMGRKF